MFMEQYLRLEPEIQLPKKNIEKWFKKSQNGSLKMHFTKKIVHKLFFFIIVCIYILKQKKM